MRGPIAAGIADDVLLERSDQETLLPGGGLPDVARLVVYPGSGPLRHGGDVCDRRRVYGAMNRHGGSLP
jgi:hypothetical protein